MRIYIFLISLFWVAMFPLQGQTTEFPKMNIKPTAYIKNYVDQKISNWLSKNANESTGEYEARTSDANKVSIQKQFEDEAITHYKVLFVRTADWSNMQIIKYDNDKQAFLIRPAVCADFMMPVPQAFSREFEEEFQTLRKTNPGFLIEGDVVKFSKLTFTNSKGETYTYDIRTVSPVTTKPTLPHITWRSPVALRVDTYKEDLDIQACVNSESQIENISVLVNGQATRGIAPVVNDGCDLTVNQNVRLAKGMNEVKIIVENKSGQSISDVCYANYATKVSDVLLSKNKRVALIVGNSTYDHSPLTNPVNDATDMSNKLKKLGFDVLLLTNMTKGQIERAIDKFGSDAREYDIALFFYAGHAIQYNGKNYLVPVNMPALEQGDERKIEFDCTPMDRVLANMEYSKCKLKLIILDACRENFTRSLTDPGLSPMNAPRGTFIAYSTSPGAKALDGTGRNSPYTAELLKRIDIKQLKIEELFKQVRAGVLERTNGQQLPWDQSSIVGDFSFND